MCGERKCFVASLQVYQALLTSEASVQRIKALKREIERAGGRVRMTVNGSVTVVALELPPPLTPARFAPDLPFYPV